MKTTKSPTEAAVKSSCQLYSLPEITEPYNPLDFLKYFSSRLKRFLKRRYNFLTNCCSNMMASDTSNRSDRVATAEIAVLKSGDAVRVKSEEEIRLTLDNWNKLKGCSFMEEMLPYCGTTQRVYKRVGTFLDERDYRTKRCKGIHILENVMCQGTRDFGPCDRSCFFFWRDEWVEKI